MSRSGVRGRGEVEEGRGLDAKVVITGLVKRWQKRGRPAVDGLSLELYENQITCLLGHNGAGKSTTVSVLTGLTPPSIGDCVVYGNSILDNLYNVRAELGVCPQKNVLFPTLTVREHLLFFAQVRGLTGKAKEAAVSASITQVHAT